MTKATNTVDARGLSCPLPILRTKKAIQAMNTGEILELIASDPGSLKDMESFCAQTGHELLLSNQEGDNFISHLQG